MDIMKYLSGMLNFDSKMDWIDEQKFTADGKPIPISDEKIATEAVPKMMTPAMTDKQVHKAAAAGEAWKKELQRWASASAELARNMKKLEIEDEQKMKELAVERDVVSQGMLQVQRDTGGRNKAVNIESIKTSEKPGYMLAEGGGYWSVNTDDPYWDTEEGYQEAIDLYGESPAWSSRPMEQENQFVDLQPTRRISL